MSDTPDRLAGIARWLQRDDDELLYAPDAGARAARPCPLARYFYILQGHTPVPVADGRLWARWFASADRHVAHTPLAPGVEVRTLFLGLNHEWRAAQPPLLFASLVCGGPRDGAQRHYSTWAEAEQGHTALCDQVRAALTAPAEGRGDRGPGALWRYAYFSFGVKLVPAWASPLARSQEGRTRKRRSPPQAPHARSGGRAERGPRRPRRGRSSRPATPHVHPGDLGAIAVAERGGDDDRHKEGRPRPGAWPPDSAPPARPASVRVAVSRGLGGVLSPRLALA